MSDATKNDPGGPSNRPNGEFIGPPQDSLAHVESPGLAPDAPGEAVKAAAEPSAERHGPEHIGAPHVNDKIPSPGTATAMGTALVLAHPRLKADAPEPDAKPAEAIPRSTFFRFRTLAAMVAIAAVLGGLAGSLATAGIGYLTTNKSKPAAPVNYTALTDALGRVNRELAVLKTGIDSAAKSTNQQVAKINDRMDRAEKAQAEAGTKLAKATDVLDRVERKLAASSTDITGTVAETHVASATPPTVDAKRPSPALIVDGWVLRDVYNGAAMIQGGSHGGVIAVLPGDTLPGLGRIEAVKRLDGRWVVVTSRGLIVSR